ncbi:zinc finger BED domain-containing protein RICESLEEPER 2-like protein [Tanacetum coccineum]|uniref:Zinc finger BED domain-containing protein RICESLEEPER 2-like protein n=1 Tax=Tanacetum coccineum TaxID=301880 RepID=A0ABQ5CPA4_9ASTR
MTHKKVADLDNEFEQFKNEFAQHRTYVDEQITTMQTMFTAELGAIRTELTAATSSITAAMERKHEELMKMLSSDGLPKDQATLGVAPTETYKAVNKLPKRPATIYKPNNDPKGLQVDDLGFPYFAYGDKPETSKLRNKGLKNIELREQLRAAVLCMEGQALSWFCLGQRFYVWEGLKRRLLERFQPSQEGTLYEQFLAITQEGSAREYVSLFETLAGQLVGIPEQVMEGTFIKGLRLGVETSRAAREKLEIGSALIIPIDFVLGTLWFAKNILMQDTGATNPVSPMYGSTTNPMQSGGENCAEVDGHSSEQSEHEYINLDDETVPTQDTNEDLGERDIGNNNGEDELELKRNCKTLPVIAPNAKYDANKMREAIASWLMVTEQPFSTVEDEMFIYMMKTANPLFGRISKPTAKADCFKVYEHEKKKLKALTNALSNISLTTDCWRSSHQKIEYMGKIFSISVDNAAYNDRVVKTLKTDFSRVKKLPCEGRLFHVRCCAHILNLLVKEGLSKISGVIDEVREAVKYINYSEARRQIFSNVAHQLQINDRKLMLDVLTRWNSTYDMLSLALNFIDVFPRHAEYEPHFSHLPSDEDWDNMTVVCEVLKVFKVCTNIISGSDYTTSNLYLKEVYKVKAIIDKSALSRNEFICDMVEAMKEKFDKYWGECHLLMAITAVLDPRMKMWYVKFCYKKIYPDVVADNAKEVSDALDHMFKEYVEMHDELVREAASHKIDLVEGAQIRDVEKCDKSELKMYLEEGLLEGHWGTKFNALEWWNVHQLKYPILSKMAKDVLAIPISTVASEATFSAGGRVIDPYRSALKSSTVEMLLCEGDWIRQNYGIKKKVKGMVAYVPLRVSWPGSIIVFSLVVKKTDGDVRCLMRS